MAGRVISRPGTVASLSIRDDGQMTSATDAAGLQVQQAVQEIQRSPKRQVVRMSLTVGRNVVQHGLARAARGYTLTPTVADASFAHAIDTSNPNPDREIWISVVGVAQPGAAIEVW